MKYSMFSEGRAMTVNREGLRRVCPTGEGAGDFSVPPPLPALMWQRGWCCFQWGSLRKCLVQPPPLGSAPWSRPSFLLDSNIRPWFWRGESWHLIDCESSAGVPPTFLLSIFIYLANLGFSCSMWDLHWVIWDLFTLCSGSVDLVWSLLLCSMWDLSSPVKDQIHFACIAKQIFNWTTR